MNKQQILPRCNTNEDRLSKRPTTVIDRANRVTVSSLLQKANDRSKLNFKTDSTKKLRSVQKESISTRNLPLHKPPLAQKSPSFLINKIPHPLLAFPIPSQRLRYTPSSYQSGNQKLQDYVLGRVLGQGSYAVVRLCLHKISNQKVAMKTYEKSRLLDPQKKKSVNREIRILQKLNHPNIIKLKGVIQSQKQLHLVLEYVSGYSFLNYLNRRLDKKIDENQARRLFKQVVQAVQYCHSRNVTHRDIKMENLLINENRQLKLIDFGFSTCFPTDRKIRLFCGTPAYMAPEIIGKKEHTGGPVDIWALGVLLFAMVAGYFPFKGSNDKEMYRKIMRGYLSYPKGLSMNTKSFISCLLMMDPNQRPSASALLQHSWFQQDSFNDSQSLFK